jgi:hypothetical protein
MLGLQIEEVIVLGEHGARMGDQSGQVSATSIVIPCFFAEEDYCPHDALAVMSYC